SQILIGEARRAALVLRDEIRELLARLVHLAALDQPADDDRQPRVVRQGRDGGGASARGRLGNAGGVDRTVSDRPQITTHKALRSVPAGVYSLTYNLCFSCMLLPLHMLGVAE